MWKRALLAYLIVSLLLTGGQNLVVHASAKTSADFKDLKDLDDKMKTQVDKWLARGFIEGVSEDQFGLHETISRAEFAKTVALALRLKVDLTRKTSSFIDVSVEDSVYGYALPYIEALREADVVDGVDKDRFNPGGEVTREQFAIFLIRGLAKNEEGRQTPGVTDETVSPYARGYVALALKLFPYLSSNGPYRGSISIDRQLIILGLEDLTQSYCGCGGSANPMGRG